MSPERAVMPRWATDSGRNVPWACVVVLLGDGIGCKCRPGVRRGTVGRRNGAEVFPERVVMPRWATDSGRNVPRACDAAPLGYGTGSKCSPSVRRGAVRRRKRAEMFPGRAARHRWATDRGRCVSVHWSEAQTCI